MKNSDLYSVRESNNSKNRKVSSYASFSGVNDVSDFDNSKTKIDELCIFYGIDHNASNIYSTSSL